RDGDRRTRREHGGRPRNGKFNQFGDRGSRRKKRLTTAGTNLILALDVQRLVAARTHKGNHGGSLNSGKSSPWIDTADSQHAFHISCKGYVLGTQLPIIAHPLSINQVTPPLPPPERPGEFLAWHHFERRPRH